MQNTGGRKTGRDWDCKTLRSPKPYRRSPCKSGGLSPVSDPLIFGLETSGVSWNLCLSMLEGQTIHFIALSANRNRRGMALQTLIVFAR
jgi:hypothetical protein